MKYTFLFLFSFLTFNSFGQKEGSLDKIITFVNDQMIMESDLNFLRNNSSDSNNSDCVFLEKLIIDKLLFSKAVKDSIPINEEEVDAELDNRLAYFMNVFGGQEKMEKYYDKTMIEIKSMFRDELRQKMLAERAKNKLLAGMSPSPKDVTEYFSKLPKDSIKYYNSEVQIAQIVFIPKISREAKRITRAKAEKIRQDIINKESMFSTQALLYSDDFGSASNNGELGFIRHGEMVPEFEQAAFTLPVGKVSDLIETKFGLHIIEVMEKRNDKVKVRHILLSTKPDNDALKATEKLADSIRTMILEKKMSFEKAVEIYSTDLAYKSNGGLLVNRKSRSTFFEIGSIEPTLAPLVSNMKVGDVTEPQSYISEGDRKLGYRIVKLVSETPPHRASLETDYFKIKEIVTETLKDKAMTNWLKFYRNYVFVKVDKSYDKCTNLQVFKRDNSK